MANSFKTKTVVGSHQRPTWFDDAKLGIFIHWGLYSVPAYAPVEGDMIQLMKKGLEYHFKHNPYAEWYQNALRIQSSPVQAFHEAHFGRDRPYEQFANDFNATLHEWNPSEWADLFQQAGARYMVLVTKHHDGFVMWPTKHRNPGMPDYYATRDIPGELAREVRARGMRFCTYYSGTLDWSFQREPIVDFASMARNGPTSREYVDYANAHWHELIDEYNPSILWNDIGYPPGTDINEIFAHHYQKNPEGIVNDRWTQIPVWARRMLKTRLVRAIANKAAQAAIASGKTDISARHHHDYVTPEYKTYPNITTQKWECTRGIGRSFGYNQVEDASHYLSDEAIIHMFIDIVSKNGNLLLNIGPMANGKIPDIQKDRVLALGKWLSINGEAIYGTRPWKRAATTTSEGTPVRFTTKGDDLFAIVLGTPSRSCLEVQKLSIPGETQVQMLGQAGTLAWNQQGTTLALKVTEFPAGSCAHAFKLTGAGNTA